MFAIISDGNGEDVDDVVVVDVDAEEAEEAELEEAIAVWLPPACVTVSVRVSVTVGVLVWASAGEGGLAGEKSDLTTETTPTITATIPNARPDLSTFLRVMLRSSGAPPVDWASSFFEPSSSASVMALSSHRSLRVRRRG
jgi:hypothetical protein